MKAAPTPPTLSSAENWSMCDPHELFLERAAKVEPGRERAFIDVQIEAFMTRASSLEDESRRWYGDVAPPPARGKDRQEDTSAFAAFFRERANAYRSYAQALGAALKLLAPTEKKRLD